MEPQRAVVRPVVDELTLPGEQPLVFKTLDGLARSETHIAGKNVHQFVLRVFWIGLVLVDLQGAGQPQALRHSGMRPQAQTRNLEIPGSRLRCAPE
jgi:hypothetical protein